jgi:hypothetical protein
MPGKLLKGKSGRRGSNPRRPAWEVEPNLKIKHIGVHGVDTGLPNTCRFKILDF